MKTQKNIKLGETTNDQIAWLRANTGLSSDTAVIELAIADLYNRRKAEYREMLIPRGKAFDLYIGRTRVAKVDQKLIDSLPPEFLARKEADRGSIFAMLMLTLAKKGQGSLTIDKEALSRVFGPQS